ncbi:MAG: hypothetical protein HYV07_27235 [Deltaproteobacteria bacterium]|nr:hypothetical protein [Deltaproteobacteria bacterium]
MRMLFLATLFLATLTLFAPRPCAACDRPKLEPAIVAAQAELVALAEVAEVTAEDRITARVTNVLKGSKPPAPIEIRGLVTVRKSRFEPCQSIVVEAGKSYIFYLLEGSRGGARVVDPLDSVDLPDNLERARKAVEQNGQASVRKQVGALESVLVSKKRTWAKDEDVDLQVIVENGGASAIPWKLRTWPPSEHSYCELEIKGLGGKHVPPTDVPIARKDIEDYFSKHGPSGDYDVPPGRAQRLTLDRINSAKPGWGYKETLGFRYYPLPPGTYQIAARCSRYFPKTVETNPITIEVTP